MNENIFFLESASNIVWICGMGPHITHNGQRMATAALPLLLPWRSDLSVSSCRVSIANCESKRKNRGQKTVDDSVYRGSVGIYQHCSQSCASNCTQ